MKESADPIAEELGQVVSGKGSTGQSARETKSDKVIRYEAQLIVKIYGKTFEEALEIARTSLAAKAAADSLICDKNRKLAQKRKQRRMEGSKKSGYI